jgi:F-type H+-transporting ATPase subunit gamma
MRKAVQSVLGTRPFARLAWETVGAIGAVTDTSLHPMLREPSKVERVLLVIISSDRGLAGGFNSNVIKKSLAEVKKLGKDVKIETVCIGRRGADAMKRSGVPIIASFTEITNSPKFTEVLPIGRLVVDEFLKGTYDKVAVVHTEFVSAVTQTPLTLELLPLGQPHDATHDPQLQATSPQTQREYTFEPSPQSVLDRLLPRLVETMMYQAVLESAASEHSARMLAMKNASDSAKDMIDALTFTFNQARQAGITQEIAEISSGKAALENS